MTTEIQTFAHVDSSRIRTLNAPLLAPGTCCICGSSRTDDRQYIDLGIDVDHIGVMYFCTFCITELVNTLGCLTQEQSEALHEELNSARQTILDFQQEKAALDGAVDTLRRTGLFSGTDLSSVIHSTETKSEPIQDVVRPEPEPVKSSKSSKQSDPKQGSTSISESGSDDLANFF